MTVIIDRTLSYIFPLHSRRPLLSNGVSKRKKVSAPQLSVDYLELVESITRARHDHYRYKTEFSTPRLEVRRERLIFGERVRVCVARRVRAENECKCGNWRHGVVRNLFRARGTRFPQFPSGFAQVPLAVGPRSVPEVISRPLPVPSGLSMSRKPTRLVAECATMRNEREEGGREGGGELAFSPRTTARRGYIRHKTLLIQRRTAAPSSRRRLGIGCFLSRRHRHSSYFPSSFTFPRIPVSHPCHPFARDSLEARANFAVPARIVIFIGRSCSTALHGRERISRPSIGCL